MVFIKILFAFIGGFIGASLGFRGQLVFTLTVLMTWLLIKIPTGLNKHVLEPLNQEYGISAASLGITVLLILGMAIGFLVLLNRLFYNFKQLYYIGDSENRILGIAVGAAIGFAIAEFFF